MKRHITETDHFATLRPVDCLDCQFAHLFFQITYVSVYFDMISLIDYFLLLAHASPLEAIYYINLKSDFVVFRRIDHGSSSIHA
jgi:hypothetical protein